MGNPQEPRAAMQLKAGTWWRAVNGYVGLGALRAVRYKFELVGHSTELRKRMDLPHRLAAVNLHRSFGNAQIAGYLFAKAAARDRNRDVAFPWAA
jgi:hypothetical protein